MATAQFNLVPGGLDIQGVVGDDFSLLFDFNIDLTGYTFDARVIFQNAPRNTYETFTILETNLSEGRITLALTDVQTKNLGPLSNAKWYISWFIGSSTRTVISGKFSLNQPWAVGDISPTTSPVSVVVETDTIDVTVIGGSGGIVLWGDIQGDIEDQTDLIQYITNSIANQPFGPGSNIACVFEGDSIMAGFGVEPDERMSYLFLQDSRLSGIGSNYWNVAESGNVLADIISDYSTEVYPRRPAAIGVQETYLFVEIGTNDIFFNTISNVDTYFSQLSGYWQQAKDDGFVVIVYTICPRKEGSAFNQSQETIRQQLNRLIRNSYIPNFLIDMASLLPDPTDLTYYLDGTHPTAISNAWLGRLMADTIANQVSSNLFNPIPFIQNSDNNFQSSQTIKSGRWWDFKGGLTGLYENACRIGYNILGTGDFEIIGSGTDLFTNLRIQLFHRGGLSLGGPVNQTDGRFRISSGAAIIDDGVSTLQVEGPGRFTGTVVASNLSGTNTGDQYGGATSSTAGQVLRRNLANSGYEFTNPSNLTNLDASKLTTGVVSAARGGAGSINGVLKADGGGTVTQAGLSDFLNIGAGTILSLTPNTTATNADIRLISKGSGTVGLVTPGLSTYLTLSDGTGIESAGTWLHGGSFEAFELSGVGTSLIDLNASNISFGTLSSARGGAGTVNGILKANGSGVVSAAVAGTDYLAPNGNGSSLTGLTAQQIAGTTTNNNADAGDIGEFVSSLVASGSAVSLSDGVSANVTSISLTAGDWDVEGNINFIGSVATISNKIAGISSTSATLPTDGSEVYSGVQMTLLTATDGITLPRKRISISGTTTVYLVAQTSFSAGTVTAFGGITARRPR